MSRDEQEHRDVRHFFRRELAVVYSLDEAADEVVARLSLLHLYQPHKVAGQLVGRRTGLVCARCAREEPVATALEEDVVGMGRTEQLANDQRWKRPRQRLH